MTGRKNSAPLIVVLIVAVGLAASAALCCGSGALLLPAIQHAREAQRRREAAENLRRMGEALQNYHETYPGEQSAEGVLPEEPDSGSGDESIDGGGSRVE